MPGQRAFRVKSAEDVIALVTLGLGFVPSDSMVMIALAEAGPFYARVDLPHVVMRRVGLTEQDLPRLMRDAFGALLPAAANNRAQRLLMVYFAEFADEPYVGGLDRALRLACRDGRLSVDCSIVTDGRRYRHVDDPGPSSIEFDPRTHVEVIRAVYEGRAVLGSRAELEASLDPAPAPIRRRIGRLASVVARRVGWGSVGAPVDSLPPSDEIVAFGRATDAMVSTAVAQHRALTDDEVARVLTACSIPPVRDLLLSRVDRDNAERYVETLRDVVRRAPRRLVAEPAALLGFCAWVSGNGALAWIALDRCWQADRSNTVAECVVGLLEAAVSPRQYSPAPLVGVRELFYVS